MTRGKKRVEEEFKVQFTDDELKDKFGIPQNYEVFVEKVMSGQKKCFEITCRTVRWVDDPLCPL